MKEKKLEPWKTLAVRKVYTSPWVEVSVLKVRLPDGQIVDDYHQIDLPDFVVIFAQVPDGQVILIRQYKQGIHGLSLCLPAGAIEEGEDPLRTAQREFLEETGYVSDEWRRLTSLVTNTNYGCGTAHVFIAKDARWYAEPNSGDLEEMQVVLFPPTRVLEAIRSGEIASLSNAAAVTLALNSITNP
jgi:ADP-ribose pyrophosphatase